MISNKLCVDSFIWRTSDILGGGFICWPKTWQKMVSRPEDKHFADLHDEVTDQKLRQVWSDLTPWLQAGCWCRVWTKGEVFGTRTTGAKTWKRRIQLLHCFYWTLIDQLFDNHILYRTNDVVSWSGQDTTSWYSLRMWHVALGLRSGLWFVWISAKPVLPQTNRHHQKASPKNHSKAPGAQQNGQMGGALPRTALGPSAQVQGVWGERLGHLGRDSDRIVIRKEATKMNDE